MFGRNLILFVVFIALLNIQFAASDLLDGLEHHHDHDHDHGHDHDHDHHDHDHHDHDDHDHDDHDIDIEDVSTPDYEDLPPGVIQFLPNLEDPFQEIRARGGVPLPSSQSAFEEVEKLSFGKPFEDEDSSNVLFGANDNTVTEDPNKHLIPVAPAGGALSFESLFNIVESDEVSSEPREIAVVSVNTEAPVLPSLVVDPILESDFDDLGLDDSRQVTEFKEVSNFIGGQGRQLQSEVRVASEEDSFEGNYPTYSEIPRTSFSCANHEFGGYYADPEAECQVFHICMQGHLMGSFLCPNQTLFNQAMFVCDWWFNVDCADAIERYDLNSRIGVVADDSFEESS